MSDLIEITLPVSNKKVELRGYTTRKDDMKSNDLLYAGVKTNYSMDTKSKKAGDIVKMDFPIANVMASRESYVPRLVTSIDGSSKDIQNIIDELHTQDYEFLFEEVEKIIDANSPKAKKA